MHQQNQQQQQQQRQQLLELLTSITSRQTSHTNPSNAPQHELNEARIQLAIRQAINPLSSVNGEALNSPTNLMPAPQPLYSNAVTASASMMNGDLVSSSSSSSSGVVNGSSATASSATSLQSGVAGLLHSLASQTAQMQTVLGAILAQQQPMTSTSTSYPDSLLAPQDHCDSPCAPLPSTLLPAVPAASSSSSSFSSTASSATGAALSFPSAAAAAATAATPPVSISNNASSTSLSMPTSPSPSACSCPSSGEAVTIGQSTTALPPPAVGVSLQASGLPASRGAYGLTIVAQPEAHHRARYLTEGSRGSVKDRLHQGYPTVQLTGWSEPVQLCVFVAADSEQIRPHSHYQACRVAGKSSAARAVELDCEGTRVLALSCDPSEGNLFSIDCIGILKLRNVDVTDNFGCGGGGGGGGGGSGSSGCGRGQKRCYTQPKQPKQAKQPKQQQQQQQSCANIRARLVFRVCLPVTDDTTGESPVVLQVASETVVCTQPVGSPEVLRVSSTEGPFHGGSDLFLIGKNFVKGSRVIFSDARGDPRWEAEAAIEADYFTQAHLICRVPAYHRTDLAAPITVQVTMRCEDRRDSEPFYYTYKPA